ncbi:MAG: lipopolysaccharide biosynthesis protein RfbH, partial [Patescibacteria group bacterium]
HPAYKGRTDIRVSGSLSNSDLLMEHAFWIGVYPGITDEMIEYVLGVFDMFMKQW